MEALLRELGFSAVHVDGRDSLRDFPDPVALCLIDLRENGEALRITRAVRAQHPQAIVIGVADPARPYAAAEAIRAGVFDVLPRPAQAGDLRALISNAREQATLAASVQPRSVESPAFGLVGNSPAMRPVMDLVQRGASGRCGILVCGERGSGREMIARAIHAHGPSTAPFVQVDCSAPVPEEVELELFGVAIKRAAVGTPSAAALNASGAAAVCTKPPVACSFSKTSRSCPREHRRGWCGSCAIARSSSRRLGTGWRSTSA